MFLVVFAMKAIGASAQTATAVNVPTWRYDNMHAGANTQETLLTPANVNTTSFGKLFSIAVDGYVYAQPLYVSGITMSDGLVHNVIYIATEHDSVYAFDADTNGGANGLPLWKASMLDPTHGAAAGATTVPSTDIGTHDIVPEIGITSTPVYDLASRTLYVVAKTKENGTYVQRIHALNMITGAEQGGSPSLPISATVTGNGNGSSGGRIAFSPTWQMNRVALDLFGGYLYIAFGSHGDNGPWHGWVMAYNASTLQQTGVICLSPNGYGNGVWGAGAGLPVDTGSNGGRIFLSTGNGSYTSYPPLSANVDYGDSIVRLDLANGSFTPGSAFTPFNQATLSNGDLDQGSGGELMLPDQPGLHTHELLQVGKEGRILLLDRDSLGGYAPGGTSNTNIIQDILGQTAGLWSTPAYWNGHVYMWGNGDTLKRFDLTNGLLSTTPSNTASVNSGFPGASPVISSNGPQSGIVWAVRSDAYNSNGSAVLYAFDANNAINPIYKSDTNTARDDAGPATKFVVPVVTNGKVYVGAAYQVDVYGPLNGVQQAPPPVINPDGGSFAGPKQVAITSSIPSSSIYYTTDGTIPTPAAIPYSGPFTISTGTTIRAVVSAPGYLQSSSSAIFTFLTQTPAPVFTPAPGSYTSAQVVTLSDAAPGAVIYYTTDGSTPTVNSPKYNGPITVNSTETVQAMATSSLTPSIIGGGTYSIQYSGAGINFGSGFSSVTGLTLNGSALHSDDSRLQLTSGGTFQAGSVFYNALMNVQSFTNDFSFQLSDAHADGFTFTIQAQGPKALGPSGGGLGYGPYTTTGTGGIPKSVAIKFDFYNNSGEGSDSTGLYTNGASPTIPAIDMTSSGVTLNSGDTINAHMAYDGTTLTMTIADAVTGKSFSQNFAINIPQIVGGNAAYVGFTGGTGGLSSSQKILTWTFVSNAAVATQTPAISPSTGSFATAQKVTITDAISGAVIYYTIDGSTPTTASSVYSGPLTISSGTVKVSAMAVAAGNAPSPVTSATITILPPAAVVPMFTPSGGTYIGAQTVAITSRTAGSTIYYTTDGSTPTASSSVYSSPISVSGNQAIDAIAMAPGYSVSQVGSAAYVIQTTGQGINFGSGFTGTAGIALNGSAQINSALSALQLTNNATFLAGTAWATTPVNVSAFTSDFIFQMQNPVADGFTFAIQSNGATAKGSSGGSLGYATISNSFALKFDIYNNQGEGKDSIGVYTGGAQPMTPATDLTGSGIVLTSGDVFHVHLVYNGTALQVSITDTNTSASYATTFPVNIPGALGTSQGYAGFTGGTGGSTVTTNILSWTFTPVSAQVTADPTFSPAPGTYTNAVQVSLSSLTPNATIYYTMDGSQPSHTSAVYSAPIQVSGNSLTIKTFASAANYSDSPIVTGSYVIQPPSVALPAISPAAGTYTSSQVVSISQPASGAQIYYTTDGSTPTVASTRYSGPFMIIGSQTVKAIAFVSGVGQSNVATTAYVIQDGGEAINFARGFAGAQGLTFNGSAANLNDGTLKVTDNAATHEGGSVFFNAPVDIRQFQTSFTFQLLNAAADGFTFTIQSNAPTALGPNGGGLGYGPDTPGGTGGIPNSAAIKFDLYSNQGEGANSTGLYTGGASPTIPAIDMTSSGINLHSGDPMLANVSYDGTTVTLTLTDLTTSKTFAQKFTVNIPSIVHANSAYVGFTGGTGGLLALQKILNWTYTQTALTQ
ncbi:chitobiase/beta-hexosaminidase C-terminal domain-containing protein [Alloacidobacterium dinghuense]|uniref:Chitobiase/beta-hexosaminidase C-terminal domain-containing protein n=1 Tax=Alloacidobacterium dinghuense TaxID=2763107 RepID=A0A7G8BNR6_9BACT|nr:chitobiase/beta-hexosaminidase C-terminal domain-containing protein [Alloacidobacterium dinghuense]QNI34186.1 chitobiase/beta-hexosaminidase C-terminal domain-containing protein [Alloacidobacterium dinghuense]